MFQTINLDFLSQLQEIKNLLEIEVNVITLKLNPTDIFFLDIKNFLNPKFKDYIKNEFKELNFCVDCTKRSLFHIRDKNIYFLLFDFNNGYYEYLRNKFLNYYDSQAFII